MSLRMLQAALLLLVVGFGVVLWSDLPDPGLISVEDIAELPLRRIFGPDLRYASMDVDLVDGVRIHELRVPSTQGLTVPGRKPGAPQRTLNGFTAKLVEIQQDTFALSAGAVALTSVRVRGARIIARETEGGLEPDFPFTLPPTRGSAPPPRLTLEDAWLYVRARHGSTRFREGAVVVLYIERLSVEPQRDGKLRLAGTVFTRELGQDDEPLLISGTVDRKRSEVDLRMDVEHVDLTPGLLDLLAEDVAAPLRQKSIRSGRLGVMLRGPPGGEVHMQVSWDADVEVQVEDIPGIETIEASTKEQLQELFGRGVLKLLVDQDQVKIDQLVTHMGGGRVEATGWIKHATGAMRIEFSIQDLELSDPAVRRALGKEGALLFEQFSPSGTVDATGTVTRAAGGEIQWSVDVVLQGATLMFIGALTEDGRREGFPYRVEEATGRVHLRPGGVFFEDIVGYHGGAEITVRGNDKQAWQGGETGRILFTDAGTDIRLTIEVVNMEVDDDVRQAVEGSEFAGLLDTFRVAGILDKMEIDITRIPGVDVYSKGNVRLQLEGEQFQYAPFPIPIEDVRGTITVRRPVLPGKGEGVHRRGRLIAFDVTGWLEGSPIRAWAEVAGHEERGRLHIEATGVPLAGALTRTVLSAETTRENLAPVWRWLDPRGRADVVASLPLREDPTPTELTTTLLGASIRIDAAESPAPLELADLTGRIHVKEGNVYFEDVKGSLGGSRTALSGSLLGGLEGRWDLHVETDPVRLTPDLLEGLAALAPGDALLPGGLRFEPGGELGLDVRLAREPGADKELTLDVTARQLDVDLLVPEAGLVHVAGQTLHVTPEAITIQDITVEMPGLAVHIDEASVPQGDGDFFGGFELRMDAFEPTAGLLALLPDRAAELLGDWTGDRLLTSTGLRVEAPRAGPVRLSGPLRLIAPESGPVGDGPRGGLTLAPLTIHTDGEATLLSGRVLLEGFSIDVGVALSELSGAIHLDRLRLGSDPGGEGRLLDIQGRVEGVRFSKLSTPLHWQKGIFRADPIVGRVADGKLQAHVSVHTRAPIAFEGAARIDGFDLAQLQEDLSPTGAPVSGVGTAEVRFQSRGGSLRDLTAAGSVRIRRGSLGDLPVVATIFAMGAKILNTRDPPQFERADVDFVLEKEVFRLSRIDLAGPLFEMPGRGTLETTGVVDLYFTPEFIKSLVLPGIMQLPVVGDIVGGVLREELLYAVRVRGDLSNAEPELVPFPSLGIRFGDGFEGTGPRRLPRRRLPRWFR